MSSLKVKRICRYPGCHASTYERFCELHPKGSYPMRDERPSAAKRGYSRKWRRVRAFFLRQNPVCEECKKTRNVVDWAPATVVDHIIPHKGDMGLFWDQSNWQALCIKHHNQKTAKGE